MAVPSLLAALVARSSCSAYMRPSPPCSRFRDLLRCTKPKASTSMSSATEPQEAADSRWRGTTKEHCEQMVERSVSRNPMVKFMLQKLEEAGCSVGREFFQVEDCAVEVGGGFRPPDGILICHNHLGSQLEIDQALTHELIHAYDHCRAKDMDWTNCKQHACSEIRAASLSGDCTFKMELMRGNLGLRQQHQKCVRRRAELSVAMNPYCGGPAGAKKAVDSVFDTCFADTAPFDRIP